MYQWFHKQHHEFNYPIAIASEYAHPVEYTIANYFPSIAGPLLFGSKMHLFTTFVWGSLRILETHEGHSGYEFPWSIFRLMPFSTDATYHFFHHSKNVGNYSSFTIIWDTIFDSNKEYFEEYPEGSRVDKKKEE
jgi:sterol desaturase/sphingolipid hydroxylase (fatty acid hydroxylase superfamily)